MMMRREDQRNKGGTDVDRSIDQISLASSYACLFLFRRSFLIAQSDECAAARQISSIDIIRKFLRGKQTKACYG